MKRLFFSIALVAALAAPGLAVAADWSIDAVHSSVGFKVRHLFTQQAGEFTDFSGTISYDPAKPEQASVNAVIQMASIDTRNEKRDGHLKSPDFFDAEKYPEMTFKSKKAKLDGDLLKVTGDLTLHGVTKEVVLDVEFLGAGDHPMMEGSMVAGFSASAKIDRKEFGIEWNKVMDKGGAMLGNDVAIQLDIEAVEIKDQAEAK